MFSLKSGCIVLIVTCGLISCRELSPDVLKYHAPWTMPQIPLILDAYHQNTIEWEELAAAPRVVGIIHKATQGCTPDPAYQTRKTDAMMRGYLWDSYHLGIAGNPEQQADCYLDVTQPTAQEVLALALEDVPTHSL